MKKLDYNAPVIVTHPVRGTSGYRMNRVICQSFGQEGHAGGDITSGEVHEL